MAQNREGQLMSIDASQPEDSIGLPIRGADVSSLKKAEDKGGKYYYEDGVPGNALQILKDHGINYIRLKVWVDPADGYNDKSTVLTMASRIKALGLKLLLDFHYSDGWADPGKQYKPKAWEDYDFDRLKQAVYNHTFDVCSSLKTQGTIPDIVQVGNEINDGILWPDGRAGFNTDNLAELLKEGCGAIKTCNSSTLVMLHRAEGGDNAGARSLLDGLSSRGVRWDVTGLSHYSYWHGPLTGLQHNLNDVASRYGKPVIVVETSYPFTLDNADDEENVVNPVSASGQMTFDYPISPTGQSDNLRDIMRVVKAVPHGRGWGVFYWEPTWTAVPGNGWDPTDPNAGNNWENQALFDFDNRPLPAMRWFRP
ncbi:MAG: arabinogalactan endo-1,4-beta-galactosidase [Anaerolineae bacterium]|nr:arabinogalactan endo-1,4-beta-galactosidase [Anaerolineae bacterium]